MQEKYKSTARKIVYASLTAWTALIPAAVWAQEHPVPEATHIPSQRGQRVASPEFCTNVGITENFFDKNRLQLSPAEVSALPFFNIPNPPARFLIEADGATPLEFGMNPDGIGVEKHTGQPYVPLSVDKYRLILDSAKRVGARLTITNLSNQNQSPSLFLECSQQNQSIPVNTTVEIPPTDTVPDVKPTVTKPLDNNKPSIKPALPENKPLVPTPTAITGHGYLPPGAQINADTQELYREKSFRDLAVEWVTVNYPGTTNLMEWYHTAIEMAGAVALPLGFGLGVRWVYRKVKR